MSHPESQEKEQSYRDNIATVDASGRRQWIYPSKPKGALHRARSWVAAALLAFLVLMPFIKWNGHPIFLLNIVERKFILFAEPFWPQDLKVLVLVFITLVVFIIVFSTIWGRLWCGWACPQTIFMEMVFRKIEFMIEGDGLAQKRLNEGPWDSDKIKKKISKHGVFLIMAYGVAHVFLAWIIGVDDLARIIQEPIGDHLSGFVALNFFSLAFYFVFSWFREQACVIVCPYGRFQSVLLDKNTTVISYDFVRGEPRGKKKRQAAAQDAVENIVTENDPVPQVGDCVDCGQCVRVCPTGIDIRNGTQLECVNCTACMDACDTIMDKLDRPKGLIRFASYEQIAKGIKTHVTTRVKAYSVVLLALLALSVYLLSSRPLSHTKVMRAHGSTYQQLEDGSVLNLYRLKLANNTFEEHELQLKLKKKLKKKLKGEADSRFDGVQLRAPENLILPSYGTQECMFNVLMPAKALKGRKMFLEMDIIGAKGRIVASETLTFIGPFKR
jgi:cytochrome c oxidase accessory protein FixG